MSTHIWQYNGADVDNFPGAHRVESLGHLLTEPLELGWRVADQFDPTDAERLAWRLDGQIVDRLMENLDANQI